MKKELAEIRLRTKCYYSDETHERESEIEKELMTNRATIGELNRKKIIDIITIVHGGLGSTLIKNKLTLHKQFSDMDYYLNYLKQ